MWWREHCYRPWGEPASADLSNPTLVRFVALLAAYAALRRVRWAADMLLSWPLDPRPQRQTAVADVRPSGLRCGICGRRPQLPETTNPRNIKEAGCPAAGDEVGGILDLAACTECFELYQAVIRRALGILRPETDLAPLQYILGPGADVPSSTPPAVARVASVRRGWLAEW